METHRVFCDVTINQLLQYSRLSNLLRSNKENLIDLHHSYEAAVLLQLR